MEDKTKSVYQNVSRDLDDVAGKIWIRRAMASMVYYKQAPDFHLLQSYLLVLSAAVL